MRRRFPKGSLPVLGNVALTGLILIALAKIPWFEPVDDFLQEFGIVLFSVCSVSLLYEMVIAEKHFEKFQEMLARRIERGENTAAVCARLGIIEMFDTREQYEQQHRLSQVAAQATTATRMRFVGRSLMLLMARNEPLKTALRNGATIELCGLAPELPDGVLSAIPDGAKPSDIQSALARFGDLIDFMARETPPGRLIYRHHSIPLFDSYALFSINEGQCFAVWDVSFGFDVQMKHIMIVDPNKPLGQNLSDRYEFVWNSATEYYPKRQQRLAATATQ